MAPPDLTRRKALKIGGLAVAGVAGCTSNLGDDPPEPSPPTATPPPTTTATGTDSRPSMPTETATPLRRDDFAFTVESSQQFTEDHPAQVRMSLTNESDATLWLKPGRLGPRDDGYNVEHTSTNAKLVVPPSHFIPQRLLDPETSKPLTRTPHPTDGCWRLNAGLELLAGVTQISLGSGESVQETFTVYAHRENESCLPEGLYRATETHTLKKVASEDVKDLRGGMEVKLTTGLRISPDSELQIDTTQASIDGPA